MRIESTKGHWNAQRRQWSVIHEHKTEPNCICLCGLWLMYAVWEHNRGTDRALNKAYITVFVCMYAVSTMSVRHSSLFEHWPVIGITDLYLFVYTQMSEDHEIPWNVCGLDHKRPVYAENTQSVGGDPRTSKYDFFRHFKMPFSYNIDLFWLLNERKLEASLSRIKHHFLTLIFIP